MQSYSAGESRCVGRSISCGLQRVVASSPESICKSSACDLLLLADLVEPVTAAIV